MFIIKLLLVLDLDLMCDFSLAFISLGKQYSLYKKLLTDLLKDQIFSNEDKMCFIQFSF